MEMRQHELFLRRRIEQMRAGTPAGWLGLLLLLVLLPFVVGAVLVLLVFFVLVGFLSALAGLMRSALAGRSARRRTSPPSGGGTIIDVEVTRTE